MHLLALVKVKLVWGCGELLEEGVLWVGWCWRWWWERELVVWLDGISWGEASILKTIPMSMALPSSSLCTFWCNCRWMLAHFKQSLSCVPYQDHHHHCFGEREVSVVQYFPHLAAQGIQYIRFFLFFAPSHCFLSWRRYLFDRTSVHALPTPHSSAFSKLTFWALQCPGMSGMHFLNCWIHGSLHTDEGIAYTTVNSYMHCGLHFLVSMIISMVCLVVSALSRSYWLSLNFQFPWQACQMFSLSSKPGMWLNTLWFIGWIGNFLVRTWLWYYC